MAYTTINKQSAHFNTKLYTGTGSSNALTGVGFQPDLVWIKFSIKVCWLFINFGNGYFGGSAVSSAGTNASNNGIFEYDVIPSDANALSTKGLNL